MSKTTDKFAPEVRDRAVRIAVVMERNRLSTGLSTGRIGRTAARFLLVCGLSG